METFKTIARRKSVRAYTTEKVRVETLDKILAAGCSAPVGMNQYDSLHLTVIQDASALKQLGGGISMVMNKFMKKENPEPFDFYGASTAVLISSKEQMLPGMDYTNAANIAENMMLAATDLGIGSCVIWASGTAAASDTILKATLAIPDEYNPLFSVVFGYASEDDHIEKDLQITISMNHV